jgi:alpha-tubulin suppressor-like RCC1 family protein
MNILGATNASLTLQSIQLADEGEYTLAVITAAGVAISDPATLFVNPPPFLLLPSARGRVLAWGGQSYSSGAPRVPRSLGETALIAAGPGSYISYTISPDGTARSWTALSALTFPSSNLVSVVPWHNGNFFSFKGYLGLGANGVVQAWDLELNPIQPPPGLRNIVQLAGNGSGHYVAVHTDGTLRHSAEPDFFPTQLANVIQAARGQEHAVALLGDGTVVMSKVLNPAEHIMPAGLTNVVRVAAGGYHTLALRADGTVLAWGRNNARQCNVPAGLSNVIEVAAGDNFSMALRSDGTVAVWGSDSQGQLLLPPKLTNVAAIAAGFRHCLALQHGPAINLPLQDLELPPGASGMFHVGVEGSDPRHYEWRFRGEVISGATNATLQVTGSFETEGLYSVTVTNPDGAISSDAMLWVGLPPEILAQPQGGVIPAGGSQTFQVLASGVGPLRHQWQLNGTNVNGATNSFHSFSSATASRSGMYQVIVSNSFGVTLSDPVDLIVFPPPTILSQPVSQTRGETESAEFIAVASGYGPLTFQWRFNGLLIPGETNHFLRIANLSTNHAGPYSVRVSNLAGTAFSTNAILTVLPAGPRIVTAPSDQAAGFGDTVRFEVVATGVPPLRYQWLREDSILPGGNGAVLLLPEADYAHEGLYSVTIENEHGSVTSSPAELSLRVKPNVVVWGTAAAARDIPPDLTNAVAVSASSHLLALRDDGTVTAWGANHDGQTNVPEGLSNVVAISAGNGHSLVLRSDGRVFAWGRNDRGQSDVPEDLTNATAIVAGSTHNLAIRSDGTVAAWGNNSFGQASPPAGLTDVIGVTATPTASLALQRDGTLVRWGLGYVPPPSATNVVAVAGRGRMLAFRSDGTVVGWGWYLFETFEIEQRVVAADSYGDLFGQGREIGLLDGGTVAVWGANLNENFHPPPGLSNVLAVSAGTLFNAAVRGGPTILRHPAGQTAAMGSEVILGVEATGRIPLNYQWQQNGTRISGATNASLTVTAQASEHAGHYSVIVSDPTGTVVSRAATVRVLTGFPYVLRAPGDAAVPEGAPAAFEVDAVGDAPLAYQWLHNGIFLAGANEHVLLISATTPSHAGLYSVRVTNAYGAVTSSEAVLTLGLSDLIVDNQEAIVNGPWQAGTNASQIGADHLFIPPGVGAHTATFVPSLPRPGRYDVYTRGFTGWPPLSPGIHLVRHEEGPSIVLPTNGTGWNSLGTYTFSAGTAGSVAILDLSAGINSGCLADALLFKYINSPPVIELQPQDSAVPEGAELHLSVHVRSAVRVEYQWQFGRMNLPGASSPTLVIPSADRAQAGLYRVLVSSTDGSLYSREATVRIVAPPLEPSLDGNVLLLRWPGTGTLQTSTNVSGPFEDIPNAASPLRITLDAPQRFYRLSK